MKCNAQASRTTAVCVICMLLLFPVVGLSGDSKEPTVTGLLEKCLSGPMSRVNEVVFAVRQGGAGGHWYENFGYYVQDTKLKVYRAMGQLCLLNVRTGRLRVLLDDKKGSVRDPQVHYGGKKIIFSYRKGGSDYFNLYEINADGTGLRQLTHGPYDDIEPTYLPDGGIMFCSSRCNRWVNCWYTQVAVLYRCEADGSDIRPISANIEHDNTPWPLPDGRVLYQRWEYVDRSRVAFHHLWTCNPDGTAQMVYYGNMHPGTVMIDAKPIPGTENKVVAIFSPGHGKSEHAGDIAIVTPKSGPDDLGSARKITSKPEYRDPWAFSEDCFMAARGPTLVVVDGRGNTQEFFRLSRELISARAEVHEPRPLLARRPENLIPPRVALQSATGKLVLADVYAGRRTEGVKRGEIASLLVLETLPKPVNYSGKMPPISFGGTYTLVRILGKVPVEPDGSAYMELPANRPLFFVALDKDDYSVKRMHSFLTVMPGETTSCLGCHEQRTRAPLNPRKRSLAALKRPPSYPEPIPGIPEVFDYPRDIQPILDRHCLKCHDYAKRCGRVILTGDHGPIYSHSFYTLTVRKQQVIDGRDRKHTNLPPRAVGTSASPLMRKLDGAHHGVELSRHEKDMIRYWIEAGAPYPGTYAALGTGMIGGFPKSKLDTSERSWPSSVAAAEAIERRCLFCHDKSLPVPRYVSDNLGLVLSNPDYNDVRCKMSRHIMFNLTRPAKSLILLAPLARESGGYGLCRERTKKGGKARPVTVFADKSDPDYQKILAACRAAAEYLNKIKRFDMPGFRPTPQYVREMRRYGIIPEGLDASEIDIYRADQAYWHSHWYQPAAH